MLLGDSYFGTGSFLCEADAVSPESQHPIPPGWYPDPGGARQWRVWTGDHWSEVTRSFGDPVPPASLASSLALIGALHRLVRYGIAAVFAGLGLLVGIHSHWPGTTSSAPAWFASVSTSAAIALLVIGSASFSVAARELQGRWTFEAFVPGVNVMLVSAIVIRRLEHRSPLRQISVEILVLGLCVLDSRAQPWLGILIALVAYRHMWQTSTLVDQLVGPPTVGLTNHQ